jgi:hypothetical protein
MLFSGVPSARKVRPKPIPVRPPLQRAAYQALAKVIRSRAEELELSTWALARKLGKPQTTVRKTLGGQRRLDPIEFLEWCDVLNLKDPVAVIRSVSRR